MLKQKQQTCEKEEFPYSNALCYTEFIPLSKLLSFKYNLMISSFGKFVSAAILLQILICQFSCLL
jgi:hypothetical protein